MNNKRSMGFFLIIIGVLVAFSSLNMLKLNILSSLLKLWPIMLIAVGLSMIFKGKKHVKQIVWISVIAIILINSVVFSGDSIVSDSGFSSLDYMKDMIIPVESNTETGNLELKVAGVNIDLDSTSNELATIKSDITNLKYLRDSDGLIIKSGASTVTSAHSGSILDISLNNNVGWNIKLDSGLLKGRLDFSDVNIRGIEINTGSSDFTIVLGEKNKELDIKIDSGISRINIIVPKEAGVYVKVKSGIKNISFKGIDFDNDEDVYKSSNYEAADIKYSIDIDSGITNLNIIAE